jgi:hypothetical protein
MFCLLNSAGMNPIRVLIVSWVFTATDASSCGSRARRGGAERGSEAVFLGLFLNLHFGGATSRYAAFDAGRVLDGEGMTLAES